MDMHILIKQYKSLVDSTHRNLGWKIKPSFTLRGLWATVSFSSPDIVIANLVQPSTGHVLELLADLRASVTFDAFCILQALGQRLVLRTINPMPEAKNSFSGCSMSKRGKLVLPNYL